MASERLQQINLIYISEYISKHFPKNKLISVIMDKHKVDDFFINKGVYEEDLLSLYYDIIVREVGSRRQAATNTYNWNW